MPVSGPGWTMVASSAGGTTSDVTRPVGRSVPAHGTKMVACPSPRENSSVAKMPPLGPSGGRFWASMMAWSSPSAPWYHDPASSMSSASLIAAAGVASTRRRPMSASSGGDGRASRSRSDETAVCVRVSPSSSRFRCAAMSSLRVSMSGAARTCRTSSTGMSRSRKRRMICAAGIWAVV